MSIAEFKSLKLNPVGAVTKLTPDQPSFTMPAPSSHSLVFIRDVGGILARVEAHKTKIPN